MYIYLTDGFCKRKGERERASLIKEKRHFVQRIIVSDQDNVCNRKLKRPYGSVETNLRVGDVTRNLDTLKVGTQPRRSRWYAFSGVTIVLPTLFHPQMPPPEGLTALHRRPNGRRAAQRGPILHGVNRVTLHGATRFPIENSNAVSSSTSSFSSHLPMPLVTYIHLREPRQTFSSEMLSI